MRDHGIEQNCTVAVRMPASFTLLLMLFALWSRGAQVMLIDFRLKPAEYERLVDLLQPQYLVDSDDRSGPVAGFRDEVDFAVRRRPTGRPNETDVCLVQCSSGSTGQPKIIGRSAHSLLAELDRYATLEGMPGKGERLVLLNSVIHAMGLVGGVLHALNAQTTLALPVGVQPTDVLGLAAETKACAIFGVPVHFDLLAGTNRILELPSLRLAVSAGEILPVEIYQRFRDRYHVPISPVYGMTEVGIIASDLAGEQPPPAVGVPAAGIEVKVSDQELYVRMDRSPYLFTDRAGRFVDGWLRT
ncbi:MAG: class I adenylate-forming enzyme family protein, partial [Pseudonocardiaceae bacterium]